MWKQKGERKENERVNDKERKNGKVDNKEERMDKKD